MSVYGKLFAVKAIAFPAQSLRTHDVKKKLKAPLVHLGAVIFEH